MMQIRIEVQVHATENLTKVKAAVLNVFPDAEFEESEGRLVAKAKSLEKLREMLRTQRIRDAARRILRSSRDEKGIRFSLNKQAAFVGKANFAPPSPMGPIEIVMTGSDLENIIDYLTGKAEVGGGKQHPQSEG